MQQNPGLNRENEKRKLNYHISNINTCTAKVNQLKTEFLSYNSSIEMLILTIITTVLAVACAVCGFLFVNGTTPVTAILIVVMLGVMVYYGAKALKYSVEYVISYLLNLCVVLSSVIYFLFFYNIVPVVIILLNWLYVIIDNYRLRKKIWKISNELEG